MRYNGNLAYDYEYAMPQRSRIRDEERKAEQQAKKALAKKKAERAHITIGCCVAALAVCAGFMISRNVAVYEGKNEVQDLQKELNTLREYSSQKAFEIDRSLDLESIEKEAEERLNMARPEKYQMVYVNIKQDDVTEVTAKEVEGTGGIFGIFN